MGLLHALQGVANHVGLIKVITVSEETETTRVTTTRLRHPRRIDDRTPERGSPHPGRIAGRTLRRLRANLTTAGIKPPPHGWDISKLEETLAGPDFKDKPHAGHPQALADLLATQKVPVEDLVKDAIARDRRAAARLQPRAAVVGARRRDRLRTTSSSSRRNGGATAASP